jgi:hypothetical protein
MLIPTFSRLPGCAKSLSPASKKRLKSLLRLMADVSDWDRALRRAVLRQQIHGLPADVGNEVGKRTAVSTKQMLDYIEQRFFLELESHG